MKKVFALIVAVTLLFIMSIPAYAAEGDIPLGASSLAASPMMMSRGAVYYDGVTYSADILKNLQNIQLLTASGGVSVGGSNGVYNLSSNTGTRLDFFGKGYAFGNFKAGLDYGLKFSFESPINPSAVALVIKSSNGPYVSKVISNFTFVDGVVSGSFDFNYDIDFSIHSLRVSYPAEIGNSNTDFKINDFSIGVADSNPVIMSSNYDWSAFDRRGTWSSYGSASSEWVALPTAPQGQYYDYNVRLLPKFDCSKLSGLYYYSCSFVLDGIDVFDENSVLVSGMTGSTVSVYYDSGGSKSSYARFTVNGVIDIADNYTGQFPFEIMFNALGHEWETFGTGITFRSDGSFCLYPVDTLYMNPDVVENSGFAAYIGSWFKNLISFLKGQEDKSESDYDQSYNPGVDDAISSAGSQVDQIEQAEGQIWNDLDTSMGEIDVGSVSIPSSILGSMMWINNIWTSCFNILPSDWQFLITFPMFLGIALVIIGRAGQAVISSDRRMSRSHDKGGVDKGA